MKGDILKNLIASICNDYIDTLLVGIEEFSKEFPYTIACVNFLNELKSKNIKVEFDNIFIDMVRDKIYRETTNYLAR